MLPTVLAIIVSVVMVCVSTILLWVLLNFQRSHQDFQKATRDLIDNLIVRVCELEKDQENGTKNPHAR